MGGAQSWREHVIPRVQLPRQGCLSQRDMMGRLHQGIDSFADEAGVRRLSLTATIPNDVAAHEQKGGHRTGWQRQGMGGHRLRQRCGEAGGSDTDGHGARRQLAHFESGLTAVFRKDGYADQCPAGYDWVPDGAVKGCAGGGGEDGGCGEVDGQVRRLVSCTCESAEGRHGLVG